MALAFNTVALIGRYKSQDAAGPLGDLARFLGERGCRVLVDEEIADLAPAGAGEAASFERIGREADLAVVLGGDGSMLSATREMSPLGVPLVGVNRGRLGFTTDIAVDNMIEAIDAIVSGRYTLEERTMLGIELLRGETIEFRTLALNDVVVNKGGTGRLIEFTVRIDGLFVYDLRADGLIVATPTGSTAYALSSNGPIIQPGVPAFALVPISPHTLSNRPVAVSDKSLVEITIKRAADARLHFDGHPVNDLQEGDRVRLERAPRPARFVHPPGYDYFAMLRAKLRWSESLF
ncbi:MAG: NAD(+)/NADH kinase [Solirubrobacteraceae bacterium]|jgi:NAD+ kinase|nr:NAD(+)/NADH kinase [Solirubrobacteraceae bacterium]